MNHEYLLLIHRIPKCCLIQRVGRAHTLALWSNDARRRLGDLLGRFLRTGTLFPPSSFLLPFGGEEGEKSAISGSWYSFLDKRFKASTRQTQTGNLVSGPVLRRNTSSTPNACRPARLEFTFVPSEKGTLQSWTGIPGRVMCCSDVCATPPRADTSLLPLCETVRFLCGPDNLGAHKGRPKLAWKQSFSKVVWKRSTFGWQSCVVFCRGLEAIMETGSGWLTRDRTWTGYYVRWCVCVNVCMYFGE